MLTLRYIICSMQLSVALLLVHHCLVQFSLANLPMPPMNTYLAQLPISTVMMVMPLLGQGLVTVKQMETSTLHPFAKVRIKETIIIIYTVYLLLYIQKKLLVCIQIDIFYISTAIFCLRLDNIINGAIHMLVGMRLLDQFHLEPLLFTPVFLATPSMAVMWQEDALETTALLLATSMAQNLIVKVYTCIHTIRIY